VHPCFSEEILKEYAVVLARSKFAFPPDEIAAVIGMFRSQGELFEPDVSAAQPNAADWMPPRGSHQRRLSVRFCPNRAATPRVGNLTAIIVSNV
jgi:hypothetical protein